MCVHDRWDGGVVDVAVSTLDILDSSDTCKTFSANELQESVHHIHTFFLSLVRQHGTKRHVTDAFDVLHRGVELIIDDDTASVV